MLPMINHLPTLGYLHKAICDCLGLWNSDNEDLTFQVSPTEKERRAALRRACETVQKDNGSYGSLDDLVIVTAQLAPKDADKVKKGKTIQTYVNYLSKSDFESFDEYLELSQYIQTLITERYARWGVSELAIDFYMSALAHYREFIREYACSTHSQTHSYQWFISQSLTDLAVALASATSPGDAWPEKNGVEQWPLRAFADTACGITGISLHKLHQYHEFQKNAPLGEQAWDRDFTSQPVNTQSKQVIDRLRKPSRVKWEVFYPILQPLTYHLPQTISEKSFARHAFAAMIAHNLNLHEADCGQFERATQSRSTTGPIDLRHAIPSSDMLELLLNDYPIHDEAFAQQTSERYQSQLDGIRTLSGSLNSAAEIPNCLNLAYRKEHRRFAEGAWPIALEGGLGWINEWKHAKDAMQAGDGLQALTHFSNALEQARYRAGPLFIPFYIQLCAFSKAQYRLHSQRKEEDLYERFYASLGSSAALYAGLLGYTPHFVRDPDTLLPQSTLPLKSKLIIGETDALARVLIDRFSVGAHRPAPSTS